MRWLIYAIIFINLTIAALIAPHVYHNTHTKYVYVGKPYDPEYPCVIMKTPHVKYILMRPGGKIEAIHKPWKPPY